MSDWIDELNERSKDDGAVIVGSEVRALVAEIVRLRAPTPHPADVAVTICGGRCCIGSLWEIDCQCCEGSGEWESGETCLTCGGDGRVKVPRPGMASEIAALRADCVAWAQRAKEASEALARVTAESASGCQKCEAEWQAEVTRLREEGERRFNEGVEAADAALSTPFIGLDHISRSFAKAAVRSALRAPSPAPSPAPSFATGGRCGDVNVLADGPCTLEKGHAGWHSDDGAAGWDDESTGRPCNRGGTGRSPSPNEKEK